MGIIELIVAVLVIFRVSRLIVKDDGPFDVINRARVRLDLYKQNTWWKRGLMCMVCVSFWPYMVLGAYIAMQRGDVWWIGVCYGLALSAVGVLLIKGDA